MRQKRWSRMRKKPEGCNADQKDTSSPLYRCGEMKPKKELIRVVKSPEGEVSLDFKGKKPGRGAFVCPQAECLKRARKARALERAFSAPMPDGVYEALEDQMREGSDG